MISRMRMFIVAVLCFVVSTISAANADELPPTLHNVSYGPHERDVLNFWKAESGRPTPVIIHIHGGGFRSGEKMEWGDTDVQRCLDVGVSFVSIEYPFYDDLSLLVIIRDHVARVVQFVRFMSDEWNIDKDRVAVYGSSAGAGSSLWIAFHDDLAQPDSDDPVLRESTRVVTAAAVRPQATYDILRWPEALKISDSDFQKLNSTLIPRSLEMYHLNSEQELYEEPGLSVRRELDMLEMIDEDDPPIYMKTNDEPSIFDLLHHPNHARTIKKHCVKHGVNAVIILRNTPVKKRPSPIDYLIEQLLFL